MAPTTKNASKNTPELLRDILKRLALKPRLKAAARGVGIDPSTLFAWIARSQRGGEDNEDLRVSWLGVERMFHEHVVIARKLSIVALDASARDQALNGWSEPKFHDGKPVWKIDPQLAADATDPEWWKLAHGDRSITDIYERDIDGGLIQEEITHPPNPQLLVKMLTSLAPDVYGEHSTVEHIHTGHVWVEVAATPQIGKPRDDMSEHFGITDKPAEHARPQNVLAVPGKITTEAFDQKYQRKLIREVIISRDEHGKIERPLDDDVIVMHSWQHKAFVEAGIDCASQTVSAEQLIEDGYQNDFLFKLAMQNPNSYKKSTRTKPPADFDDKPGDTALVRDLKAKARAAIAGKLANPLPRGKHGERTIPKMATAPTNDPPEKITGQGVNATDGNPHSVGVGREQLGRGVVAPGGYSTTPAPSGRPRSYIR